MCAEAAFEMVPVGGFGGRPGAFGEGDESGKELAVDEGGFAVDVGPKVGLDPEEVFGLIRGEFGDGVECVGFFGADGFVGVIEIAVAGGRHHGIVAGLSGLSAAADPIHDSGVRGEAAFEDFAPADESATFGVDMLFDASDEIALEFVFVFQAFGFDACLAFGAGFPALFRSFIAADMNEC